MKEFDRWLSGDEVHTYDYLPEQVYDVISRGVLT